MALEQIESKETDARSDIFASSAVLYEMLTGKRAFEGKSQLSVASAILEKDPQPISAVRNTNCPAVEHIIERALQKDPEKRWQDAGDLRAELQWAGSSNAVTGRSSLVTTRRRERWLLAAVTGTFASIAIVLFF